MVLGPKWSWDKLFFKPMWQLVGTLQGKQKYLRDALKMHAIKRPGSPGYSPSNSNTINGNICSNKSLLRLLDTSKLNKSHISCILLFFMYHCLDGTTISLADSRITPLLRTNSVTRQHFLRPSTKNFQHARPCVPPQIWEILYPPMNVFSKCFFCRLLC